MSASSAFSLAQSKVTTVCQLAYPTAKPIMRYYDGAGGGALANVPNETAPYTAAILLTTGLVSPAINRADNYSARSRGYIRPTVSGLYTIWISSDDAGAFSLGAANGSNCNLPVNISNAGYSGAQGTGGVSYTVNLVAGQAYPFEVVFSESGAGDYVQVDWSVGASPRAVIPISVLFAENPNSLQKRTLISSTLNNVTTYTDLLLNPVTPTLEQPIIDCAVNYNFGCGSASVAVRNYTTNALAIADATLLPNTMYSVGATKQLFIK